MGAIWKNSTMTSAQIVTTTTAKSHETSAIASVRDGYVGLKPLQLCHIFIKSRNITDVDQQTVSTAMS